MFIHPQLFTKIITPLLLMQHCALICMSTQNTQNKEEFGSFIAEDAEVFKRYDYSFVCARCRAENKTTACPHIRNRIPPWQSERRHAVVESMMSRHKEDMERETLNIDTGGAGCGCFGKRLVEDWWALPRLESHDTVPKFVMVTIDPANGQHSRSAKQSSMFAVVATWYHEVRSRSIVCGVDAYPVVEPEDWIDRLKEFLRQIRSRDEFKYVPLVCCPENMTGTEAGSVRQVFTQNFDNVLVVRENDFRTGLPSNAQIKRDMMVATKMRMQQGLLRFAPDATMACTGDLQTTLKALKQQMLDYAEIRKPGKDPWDAVRVSYTGKGSGPDDLATMLQFNVYATDWVLKYRADQL